MSEDKWQRVKDVFWAAHELPVEEREDYARAQCADDDAEVLTDVLAMLSGDAGAESSFLRSPMPAPTAERDMPDLPRRLGKYELVQLLGRGGMGMVFRARQSGLDREVAVKVLPPWFAVDERLVARFQREARAVGKLRHPGIVPVYDVGVADREHYFVMELVDGHDLYHELRRLRGDEPEPHFLPKPESHEYLTAVVQLIVKVARSLAYAHDNGVVHRDIKPRNLIVERVDGDASPRAAVLDFGLARDVSQGQHSLTHEVAGTPHYMSPEQIDAKRAKVDERTDLYSLGVVLYELLTLTHPFHGKTDLEVMQQISAREPLPPRALNPRVPRDLETICLKAIEKEPKDRYADMDAFADDLRRFLDHEAVLAARPSLRARGSRHLRRHRRSYAAACVGALVIALVGVVGWAFARVARVEELRQRLTEGRRVPVAERSTNECQALERDADALLELVDPESEAGLLAAGVLRDLAAHIDELTVDGRELVYGEIDPPVENPDTVLPSEARFQEGLQLLSRASMLRPHDRVLASESRAEHHAPKVEFVLDDALRAAAAAGELRVFIATRDWSGVGPLRPLAGWQDGAVQVPPGDYRFRVVRDGVGAAEFTRWIRLYGHTYSLTPNLVPHEELTRGMVHIPAGSTRVFQGFGEERYPWNREHTMHIEEFWIDRTEVSNAEYREFLIATGRPPHWMWAFGNFDVPREEFPKATFDLPEDWLDLPVAGVRYFDARDYAEWAGKRLPTWFEWQRAAAGPEAWALPWSAEPVSVEELERRAVVARPNVDPNPKRLGYYGAVVPVGRDLGDITDSGLLHMLGNVAEYTEDYRVFGFTDRPVVNPSSRIVGGLGWRSSASQGDLLHSMASRAYHDGAAGFRCVVATPKPQGD